MDDDKMAALLARAASGDMTAAAAFQRARAARVDAGERFRASGRAAAWRMIRASE
ncbi:hypothetical protein ACFV3R_09690 [Streptomyces sp. NPDC059740]|uniref:hypothetical protein n=1 Tax=Streptomyces sp. NPDC059740 TaxID=3346926 RepID=UPI00365D7CFC